MFNNENTKTGTVMMLGSLEQCFSKGSTCTTGGTGMVAWWYVKKCKTYFFQ